MKILFVTAQHMLHAPRKTGLHFLAQIFLGQGHELDLLSHRLSWMSKLTGDPRWSLATQTSLNRWVELQPRCRQFVWTLPVHPISSQRPILSTLSSAFLANYDRLLPRKVVEDLPRYDLIFIESGISVMLFERMKLENPTARFIYYAADRLDSIGVHPAVGRRLCKDAPLYDLIRIVAPSMAADFPAGAKVRYIPHGVQVEVFDEASSSPYGDSGRRNVVSVGDMLFDRDTVTFLAERYPEVDFHLIGSKAVVERKFSNVHEHGEQPFEKVAAFIKYADVGIAPYRHKAGAEYLGESSLKMIQYSYCRLPILAPWFCRGQRNNVFAYHTAGEAELWSERELPGSQQSVGSKPPDLALSDALRFDASTCMFEEVRTWSDVAREMLHETGFDA